MGKTLKYKKYTGLQIFCTKCRSIIHVNSSNKNCNHPIDKQVYKAVIRIPGTGGKRATRNLVARDYDEAVKELIEFKLTVTDPNTEVIVEDVKPQLLIDCIAMYLDYQSDVGIPYHQKKYLDRKYIVTTSAHLNYFLKFIRDYIKDTQSFLLNNLNDIIIGKYVEYIENHTDSNYTFNGRIKALRGLYSYLINEKNYNIKNGWKKVKTKSERATNKSVKARDFYDLIDIISPEDSIYIYKSGSKKNMYKSWLKDAIMLSAFTGRRNEEIFSLKWNMIKYNDDNEPIILVSPDIKYNKLTNNFDEKDYKLHYIPIASELNELLKDMGLNENKDSSDYIIEPNFKSNRKNLVDGFGSRFTFYFRKLKRSYINQLKHLRKTFITQQNLMIQNNKVSLQHTSYSTTEKHYLDNNVIAIEMVKKGFRVFPPREDLQ